MLHGVGGCPKPEKLLSEKRLSHDNIVQNQFFSRGPFMKITRLLQGYLSPTFPPLGYICGLNC